MSIGDDSDDEDDDWILDSGSSRHLMNDTSLLRDARDCDQECHLADGETTKLTQVGSVVLTVLARGQQQDVTLTDV
uniref:Retrovirus-related Pol polyprotein from transposon TNT 1-94-like beta-barrel domain-containing protein n=1 Tax=Peronospora matthiolae TaxID=2874970 RepID=A0AAV1TBU1_9STRA